MSSKKTETYTHGHHASVLRSHTWRTAANSAAFLLPHIKPDATLLDVGCGPGTITLDFGGLVPNGSVTGLDAAAEVIAAANSTAKERGITNVTFVTGDAYNLPFEDASFDVVHAHQVLQHVGDPVKVLREMTRVLKPGGVLAARDSDMASFAWWPSRPALEQEWKDTYFAVARANGGNPDAGKRLHAWAREAGLDPAKLTRTASCWCYSTPDEVQWWSDLWADRTIHSSFGTTAKKHGLADDEKLQRISDQWRAWGKDDDAWFAVMHGEILYHK